jgi:hypothetical protein
MSAYISDLQNAAKLGANGDAGEMISGTKTVTTSQTTAVVTHGLSGKPDFIIATAEKSFGVKSTANTTSITFTVATAATSNTISYVAGYSA